MTWQLKNEQPNMSNKVSTSENKKKKFRAFCQNSNNLLSHRARQISLTVVFFVCLFVCFFFLAVKNCALKNFLEKNLTIK